MTLKFWKRTTLILAVSFLTLGTGSWYLMAKSNNKKFWHTRPSTKAAPSIQAYDFSPLVSRVKGAVFNLSVTGRSPSRRFNTPGYFRRFKRRRGFPFFDEDNPFRRRYRSPRRRYRRWIRPRHSAGTGFLINAEGYALTNNHVVRNAGKITAQLADKRVFKVKVIGKTSFVDLALIKLIIPKGTKLPHVFLGNSDKLKVGEPVVAIGNAKALGLTVTAGIVSARGRVLRGNNYNNYIQTDAAINRGNSGGPLFNKRGEVVGINTAILRNGRGIGFAIPINLALSVLPQLRTKGKVERAQLGVMIQHVSGSLARSFGLKRPRGALVARVTPNSPAAKAGIRAGDIILKVNQQVVENHNQLPIKIAFLSPGQQVTLQVLRNRKKIKIKVVLQKWGGDEDGNFLSDNSSSGSKPNSQQNKKTAKKLGMTVTKVSKSVRKSFKLKAKGGVQVVSLKAGGPAKQNGVRSGDVIVAVNQIPVKSVAHFHKIVGKIKSGGYVLLRIKRQGTALFVAFSID